jgi:hypothetical protein
MLAQIPDIPIPTSGAGLKIWLFGTVFIIASMVIGRFVFAFKNGAGLKDAFLSVWLGTNSKPQKKEDSNEQSKS